MWRAACLAIIRAKWKERNAGCFNGTIAKAVSLAELLKYTVASWVQSIPYFHGYSLDQLMHNWRKVAGLGKSPALDLSFFRGFSSLCSHSYKIKKKGTK